MTNTAGIRKWILMLPVFGIAGFLICYIIAAILYPGGSQQDAASRGFSVMHNYWCNLLNKNAINGELNSGRPFALAGMSLLSVSIAVFWYFFPIHLAHKPARRIAIQLSGCMAGIAGFFIFANAHDILINLAFIFGCLALTETFIGLYTLRWNFLFGFGIFNLLLVGLNNFLYYKKDMLFYLPLVQKISFISFLVWMIWMNVRLLRSR